MIVEVSESSQVSSARRTATEIGAATGLDEIGTGRAALIATEMATNILKHAGRGEIVIDRFDDAGGSGIELLSLDKGRGIPDISQALTDGYSTAGSAGTGLGAIRRQADQFAIFSHAGGGAAIVARIRGRGDAAAPPTAAGIAATVSAITLPFPGESHCGDAWSFRATPSGPTLLAVDGTGHGSQAELAARAALDTFGEHGDRDCVFLVDAIHRRLSLTRGAAVAVARVDMDAHMIRFVGVGNISGMLISEFGTKRMVSHNGTAGYVAPRIREFTYPFEGDPSIVLHSDGLSSRWELDTYPGLTMSHTSLIAGVLFRDHRRARDDATIVVMRIGP